MRRQRRPLDALLGDAPGQCPTLLPVIGQESQHGVPKLDILAAFDPRAQEEVEAVIDCGLRLRDLIADSDRGTASAGDLDQRQCRHGVAQLASETRNRTSAA
jgi:hypothetical protein